jgi:hypothetical protein
MTNWLRKSTFSAVICAQCVCAQHLAAQTEMNRTPSAVEFSGAYNIDPGVLRQDGESISPEECLTITKGLSRPSIDEAWQVHDLIREYARDQSINKDQLYCEPKTDDRTVYVTFRKLADLKLDHLNGLQNLLRKQAPNWRIAVIGISPETTVIVYPTAIAFPRKGVYQEVLNSIRTELEEFKDRTDGAEKRQKMWVEHLLRETPPREWDVSQGPKVIAAFDNSAGNRDWFCFWMLTGDGARLVDWWPQDDESLGIGIASGHFDLTSAFQAKPFFTAKKSELMGVVEPVVVEKAKYNGKIEFQVRWDDSKLGRKARASYQGKLKSMVVELTGHDVLSDQELKDKLKNLK